MRLFAAIPIAEPVRDQLDRLIRRLERRAWPIRWTRTDAFHLTLKFYGEVAEARLHEISAALESAALGTGVLPMALSGTGAFPAWSRPRVLWLGLEAPPALELLQHRVETASASLGFPVEGSPFTPHITLGRLKDGARLPTAALSDLQGIALAGSFLADALVLYESRVGPQGAGHTPRGTFALSS